MHSVPSPRDTEASVGMQHYKHPLQWAALVGQWLIVFQVSILNSQPLDPLLHLNGLKAALD